MNISITDSSKVGHEIISDVLVQLKLIQTCCKQVNSRVRTILVLGYWVLANTCQYWYCPNTFLSNCAQYWADNSLRRRLATTI